MEYSILIITHMLAATVWTGGHLVLALTILPGALKRDDIDLIKKFEESYERIGIPALFIQIVTGLRLSYLFLPQVSNWFGFGSRVSAHLTLKFVLLALTLLLAIHARFRIVPALHKNNLKLLAAHIIVVTVLAVSFVVVGASIRVGGLF